MSDLLQTIKDQIAVEHEYSDWHQIECLDIDNCEKAEIRDNIWPEVCKRYAFEVAKNALKNASENAKMEVIEVPGGKFMHRIVRSRITSESNIKI